MRLTRRVETALWLTAGVCALAALELVRPPEETLLWGALFNTGHAPLFCGLGVASYRLAKLWVPQRSPLVLAALAVVGLALVTEGVQVFTHRDADPIDFVRDLVGGGAALAVCATWRRRSLWAYAVWFAAVVAVVVTFYPLARVVQSYRDRAEVFPRLIAFERANQQLFMELSGSRLVSRGEVGVVTYYSGGTYPRFGMLEVEPDWRGYQRMTARVYNPADRPIELHLRIHDYGHSAAMSDRYNGSFTLEPGDNDVSLPLAKVQHGPSNGRLVDLSAIQTVHFFVVEPQQDTELHFQDVRLQ